MASLIRPRIYYDFLKFDASIFLAFYIMSLAAVIVFDASCCIEFMSYDGIVAKYYGVKLCEDYGISISFER